MRSRRRRTIVGLVAVCRVLLVALGIQGLGKLLEASKILGEMLTTRVPNLTIYTTASLSLGLTMIVWCFITRIAWARSARLVVAGSEAPPAEKRWFGASRFLSMTVSGTRWQPQKVMSDLVALAHSEARQL